MGVDVRVSAVVAMSENRVIGLQNQLPWRLPEDLKRFRTLTLGHPILMGRKTFESIGRVLPGRENLIISRQPDYRVKGARVFGAVQEAIDSCAETDELFIIGGAEIYRLTLDRVERLYLTLVHQQIQGDAFFPEFSFTDFREVQRDVHQQNGLSYSFLVLDSVRNLKLIDQGAV